MLVNSATIFDAIHATVNITISPIAAHCSGVSATAGGVTASGANPSRDRRPAYIGAVNRRRSRPDGAAGHHLRPRLAFTAAPAGPIVSLGPDVLVTQVVVDSDTQLGDYRHPASAPDRFNDVVTTLGGERRRCPADSTSSR
jgi:hypothetical protein